MLNETTRLVDDNPQYQQPGQDDKKLPRRCLHALASLAGAATAVKACAQYLLGNFEQGSDASAHLLQNRARNFSGFLGLPLAPIQIFQMLGENRTSDAQARREAYFERITLYSAGDRANDRETGLLVVTPRRENYRGPSAGLFSARLRREIEPNQIAGVGHVFAGYHNSFPAGPPQSLSR